MPVVTSVTVGSKKIDLEAFTGIVVESEMTTYTRESTQTRSDGSHYRQYSTSYWNKFRVQGAGGKEWSLEVLRTVASVTKGDQVTLFWGVVSGKESDWLSVYNHSTEHLGFVPQTTAKLAGPPLYTVMLFGCGVIQFFALFGMFQWSLSAWFAFLLFSVPWAWVFQRRATLKKAVRDAIPRPGQAQPLTANAPPPRAPDREIRI
jgi:hypothetical protein